MLENGSSVQKAYLQHVDIWTTTLFQTYHVWQWLWNKVETPPWSFLSCFIIQIFLSLSLRGVVRLTFLAQVELKKWFMIWRAPLSYGCTWFKICYPIPSVDIFLCHLRTRLFDRLIIFSRIFSALGNVFLRFFLCFIETQMWSTHSSQSKVALYFVCYNTIYINLSLYVISESSHS